MQENNDRNGSDLPEFVASSETSFGTFVMAETEDETNADSTAGSGNTRPVQFLPPDDGKCAAHMLNMEIMAHARTEAALQMASTKASIFERHYAYQSIALAAWQSSYQECLAKIQSQVEEIEKLKGKNAQLLRNGYCWHFRPVSN